MRVGEREFIFDDWAHCYDASVASTSSFPFDGYEKALDEVVRLAGVAQGMRILELGIGTGNLAARFMSKGCTVCGVDFSARMLAETRRKLPQARLAQADLLGDWPAELGLFDRVVSAYTLHEFCLDAKMDILCRALSRHLSRDGYVVVADIAFPSVAARAKASHRWADAWDGDEFYWAADETMGACARCNLRGTYKQVSPCGGVFTFRMRGAGSSLVWFRSAPKGERRLLNQSRTASVAGQTAG